MRFRLHRCLATRRAACSLFLSALIAGSLPAWGATPQVSEAWIRWLPGDLPAAAYVTVNNPGTAPVVLLGASSADYSDVSLHRSEMHQGSMQMLPLERLVIPAHTMLRFELLGYHLMLMQATRPLKPGDRVTIVLRFADTPPLPVVFEVRKPDGSRAD